MTLAKGEHLTTDLFARAKTVSFSTLAQVPFGVRIAVATAPKRDEGGKWVAGLQTDKLAFVAELQDSELPGSSFILVRSSSEDGEHYDCLAVLPEEFDRVSADIESSVLRSLSLEDFSVVR
jgi:hypothetical protein